MISRIVLLMYMIFVSNSGETKVIDHKPVTNNWYDNVRPTDKYLSLNGEWHLKKVIANRKNLWASPSDYDSTATIPELYYSRRKVLPESNDLIINWYEKSFMLPLQIRDAINKRNIIFIHLGGVAWRWSAWLNGQKIVIDNLDALDEQNFDITPYLNLKGENSIVIAATNSHGLCENLQYAKLFNPGVKADRDGDFIAPAPEANADPIIWGEVEIWSRPKSRIEEIFIKPSFRNKNLGVSFEIEKPQKGRIQIQLTDSEGNPINIKLDQIPVSMEKEKESLKINTIIDWKNPRLWEPEDPFLYYAVITYYNEKGNKIIDRQKVRFGFRELWIDKNNLIMNGKRLFLARHSIITGNEHSIESFNGEIKYESIKEQLQKLSEKWKPNNSINSLRLHRCAFIRPGAFAWYADELGIILVPETATPMGDRFVVTDTGFWKNSKIYLERWVKSGRNYPSIVMWSLTNEFLWCGAQRKNPESHNLMYDQEVFVKSIDPTRFIGWDGDWDLPALKIPLSGKSETVNLHYPFESNLAWYPTESWSFVDFSPQNPIPIRGHYGTYNWPTGSKPIVVGEYAWNQKNYFEGPATMTKYAGDLAYNWNYWITGYIQRKVIKWQTDAWRVARFAGLNPWTQTTKTHYSLMPLETVIIRDPERSYDASSTVYFQAFLLNDTQRDREYVVEYRLLNEIDSIVFVHETFKVIGGGMADFIMPVRLPLIEKSTNYKLVVTLKRDNKIVNQEQYNLRVRPKEKLEWPVNLVLYDPAGENLKVFQQLGLNPRVTESIQEGFKSKGLILGANCLSTHLSVAEQQMIFAYVANGGNLLLLGEVSIPPASGLKIATNKYKSNHAWVRAVNHPVLDGIGDLDLGFWGKDQWVNNYSFYKPFNNTGLMWRTLIDVGATEGLENVVLAEIFLGKGKMILNQLDLSKSTESAGAKAVLLRLLKYINTPNYKRTNVSLFMGDNNVVAKSLVESKIRKVSWAKSKVDIPLFIDANYDKIPIEDLSSWVSNGGKVWLLNLTANNFRRWKPILKDIDVEPVESFDGALIVNQDSLLWGISNEEFFWCEGYWTTSTLAPNENNRGPMITKMANIGSASFYSNSPAFKPLTNPSVLAAYKQGKGIWLLSSIDFEAGSNAVHKKYGRFIQSVFTNFGLQTETLHRVDSDTFYPLRINEFVNRGFQDDVALDGEGGWTDEGFQRDLHFFPQNISGLDMASLPQPIPDQKDWPSLLTLNGINFEIIDPRTNKNKSCIMLQGKNENTLKNNYLTTVEGIVVNKKIKALCSLHASAFLENVKEGDVLWHYILQYKDGQQLLLPVKYMEQSAGWDNPGELSDASVAWIGSGLKIRPIGLFVAIFENPYPNKVVSTISIHAEPLKAVNGIIALSVLIGKN